MTRKKRATKTKTAKPKPTLSPEEVITSSTVKDLQKKLRKSQELAAAKGLLSDSIADAVRELPRADVIGTIQVVKSPKSKTPISAVALLGDWHVGCQVDAHEVEGFNQFNWEVTKERVNRFANSFLNWIAAQKASYPIDKCVVVGLADFISGMIHTELLIYNEFSVPKQVSKAGVLLGDFLRTVAANFKEVEFYGTAADNHSRMFAKPMAKGKSDWSLGSLVYFIAQQRIADLDNVKFHVMPGAKGIFTTANHKFLIEHGDGIKGQMGIPWYGIQRLQGKEAMKRLNRPEVAFDYHLFGHWHTPIWFERTIVNGALTGTQEYDHLAGRYAWPSQTGFLVHPRRGVFNNIFFDLR